MDTMTLTKVTAAVCGALLVLLLGKWAAEALYQVEGDGEAGYVIATESAEGTQEEVVEVSLEELMASADIAKGAKTYKKCAACHKVADGVNGVGPSLYGIVDRAIGSGAGFDYSGAMSGKGGDWTVAELDAFLTKPKAYLPGTTMSFSGLKKATDRVNVIAYLDSLDD
ncbi:MAG: c-type cytochrome [Rhodobacteraceae bacterium]|nr:c-type cytochrome [Paracoccaceae bacterium]